MENQFNEDLINQADKKIDTTYTIDLSADEITQVKDDLSKNSIDIATLEAELKEYRTDIKTRVKALKEANNVHMSEIKTGKRECYGSVLLVPDHVNEVMDFIIPDGTVVKQRPLNQDEKQLRISKAE